MSAVKSLNQFAEVVLQRSALGVNLQGAAGLANTLRSNLGPRGTLKMLVSGGGEIKLTKDGAVLLHEMQIQLPTAQIIARSATAQDDITGDGTTSLILLIGELMKRSVILMEDDGDSINREHTPRRLSSGFEIARVEAMKIIDQMSQPREMTRDLLLQVAQTALRTKIKAALADQMAEIVTDAVLSIKREDMIDLKMIELMLMQHRTEEDSALIKGLVLDHGRRHPGMPRELHNCYILTMNVSLEYERSEVNASFMYSSAEQREELTRAERRMIDQRCQMIVDLKNRLCSGENSHKSLVVLNQKGIDGISLEILAKNGILGLRRAKRRNMERLIRACGGEAVNSLEGISEAQLGYAGHVSEAVLGEDKFTFIEECPKRQSVTILLRGSTGYALARVRDALKDGLRAVKNAVESERVVPGAGAFHLKAHRHIMQMIHNGEIPTRSLAGARVFAESLLVIPKTLAHNGGFSTEVVTEAQQMLARSDDDSVIGIDVFSGSHFDPAAAGVWDGYRCLKHMIYSAETLTSQLILCDTIIAAGVGRVRQSMKQQALQQAGLPPGVAPIS